MGARKVRVAFFNTLHCVKLQRGPSEHPLTIRITIRLALELTDDPYDLSAYSNAIRITKRLVNWCSKDQRYVFSGLDCVKLQRGPFEHPSVSCINIRLALEFPDKPYDLPTSSNTKRIIKQLVDGCSKGPRCVFSDLDCVKLQRGAFDHISSIRITIRIALKLVGKSYDLPTSSNASELTIRLIDVCSDGPRYGFSALNSVNLQRGSSAHPSISRIIIRIALELADKSYDLPASSNASRITKRLADGCSEGPCCVFSALVCVKLQREHFEHPSASRITISFALELASKPYDLQVSSNARQLTIRLVDVCSKGPRCVFSALDCIKLQRGSSEHSSASRITIRLALELAGKPYDLPASSNAKRITKRLADVCSKDPHCVFSALNCIKLQRGSFEHASASRITIRLVDGCSEGPRCVFSTLDCVKLQRESFEHSSASRITIRLALELAGKAYDLPANSNAKCITNGLSMGARKHSSPSRITIRLALDLAGKSYDLPASSNANRLTIQFADGCSEDPRCVFSALNYVKLQRGSSENPSVSRITIRLALELADKPYDLSASSNAKCITKRLADGCSEELNGKSYDLSTSSSANRITKRFADGCLEGPRCVLNALDCVKLQRGTFEHPSASRITIRFALELTDKPYDLPASSNASRLTIRIVDGCSKGSRCVFSALDCVKSQRGPSEHSLASLIIIRIALELADKAYDLPTSSNAKRITKRLVDGCSEGSRYVFSALYCVKLQREPFEHPSANRITIRPALKLAGKPYDLSVISTTSCLTIRLANGCSESPRCVFSALDCVKLQRGPSKHPSASRITIRLALELADKPYVFSASYNAKRITKRLVDGCSEGPHCIFSAVDYVKLQRGPFEHPSASRITIRFALELADKPYDLSHTSASRMVMRFALELTGPPCVFNALDCVKLQRGSFEHPSVSRINIRFALEIAKKAYDLPASSNAKRITKRLADGCSKDPRCVFSALYCVKLQRGPFEHTSSIHITIQFALKLAIKSYDLSTSSNASELTIRFADVCSEGPRCVFSALNCVKLQRRPFEHPSASRITIRLALEFADKSYDLPASSNAIRIAKRLTDGCSEGPRCVFSALVCVNLQRGSFEYSSASRIIIRFALKLADKPYDLLVSSNASQLTIRLADGCSKDPRCVFSALDCVNLQRGSFGHSSANGITIRLALEFADKSYDLSASSSAKRITKRLTEAPRCVFNALNCVNLQREPSKHSSASRIIIRLTLELADKPYRSSNARRITKRLVDGYSQGPRYVFNALDCAKLQRGAFEHPSANRITIRLALELVGNPYDLPASSTISRLTIRLADVCSESLRCIFNALDCVKLQRGPSEHSSASRITIRLALELAGKAYDFSASSNAKRITKRLVDGCSKSPRCVFSAVDCVKLQRGPFEHPSANRITIRFALELVVKPYDLPASSNANRLTIRLVDGCSEGPHCVFSALNYF
ncbi:hypothetical protein L7F22_053748 [Adiantum nelumboides]|nr:hypothetical protein [Adiantum nelumboides]